MCIEPLLNTYLLKCTLNTVFLEVTYLVIQKSFCFIFQFMEFFFSYTTIVQYFLTLSMDSIKFEKWVNNNFSSVELFDEAV